MPGLRRSPESPVLKEDDKDVSSPGRMRAKGLPVKLSPRFCTNKRATDTVEIPAEVNIS